MTVFAQPTETESTPADETAVRSGATIPHLPGPPIVGHAMALQNDRLGLFQRTVVACGDIGSFTVGPQTVVLLNSPALAHDVLVTQAAAFEKPYTLRDYTKELFGNGLVSSLNSFHGRQRKLVAPAFQHRRVVTYADIMAGDAERIQEEWSDGATLDLSHEMMRVTMWIVGKTLFDADVTTDDAALDKPIVRGNRLLNRRVTGLFPIPLWIPTLQNLRDRHAIDQINKIVYRIIAERRADPGDRGDLLSMLLTAQHADDGTLMTDLQVRDEAMTLFLAGHETTANALTWSWYLLSQPRHRRIYQHMQAEIDSTLQGRTPTYADLKALPYTLQVLKESMRLYPPVPSVAREATDGPVVVGGYRFRRRSVFVINPYTLHRHPSVWTDPETFDPERFADGAEARLPKGAYIPFISGPRNCIGNQFATMEGHLLLAAFAQRVTFEFVPNQRVEPEALITLRPKYGMKVVVRRRNIPRVAAAG